MDNEVNNSTAISSGTVATGSVQVSQAAGSVATDGRGNVVARGGSVEAAAGAIGDAPLFDGKERPAWLPKEFTGSTFKEFDDWYRKTVEAPNDGKGVQDPLELTQQAQPAAEEAKPQTEAEQQQAQSAARTDDEIRAVLKEAGGLYADPRYEPFAIAYERGGKLDDTQIAQAAAAFGVTTDVVKDVIKGQEALRAHAASQAKTQADAHQQANIAAVLAVEGLRNAADTGATYEAMMKWADQPGSPINDATKAAYNKALDAGDTATVTALAGAMFQQYQLAGNTTRREITGSGNQVNVSGASAAEGQTATVKPYASRAEYERDVNTRRYNDDPQFRNAVDARYVASSI
jgi:hypothetical protein